MHFGENYLYFIKEPYAQKMEKKEMCPTKEERNEKNIVGALLYFCSIFACNCDGMYLKISPESG